MDGSGILNWGGGHVLTNGWSAVYKWPKLLKMLADWGPPWIRPWLTDKIRRWRGGEGVGQWWQLQPVHWKEKYRQPFHNKIPNGDKLLDQLKYQQKKISLELQRRRSFVLNPLVDLVSSRIWRNDFWTRSISLISASVRSAFLTGIPNSSMLLTCNIAYVLSFATVRKKVVISKVINFNSAFKSCYLQ